MHGLVVDHREVLLIVQGVLSAFVESLAELLWVLLNVKAADTSCHQSLVICLCIQVDRSNCKGQSMASSALLNSLIFGQPEVRLGVEVLGVLGNLKHKSNHWAYSWLPRQEVSCLPCVSCAKGSAS